MQAYTSAPVTYAPVTLGTLAQPPATAVAMAQPYMPASFNAVPRQPANLALRQPLQQDVYMKPQQSPPLPNPAAMALPSLPATAGALQGLPPAPEVLAPWLYFPMKNGANPQQLAAQGMAQSGLSAGAAGYGQPMNPVAGSPVGEGGSAAANSQDNPSAMMPPPTPEALPDAGAKALDKQQTDADAKPSSHGASQEALIHGFDESLRTSLNARLEDPDWQKRGQASNEFFLTLQASPALAKNPATKPYIDAFALKILRDPMSAVHTPILLAIQTGYYNHPSQAVMQQLQQLKSARGMLGLEPQQVSDALYALQQMQATERTEARENAAASGAAPLMPSMEQTYLPTGYPQGGGGELGSFSTPPLAASVPLQGLPASASNGFSLKRLWPFSRNSQNQGQMSPEAPPLNGFTSEAMQGAGQRLNLLSAAGA
jgi:hypothetical protein